ncbi:hypothetical protein AK830_g3005 [Neonectria ditissima]|uniref:C2H2-type domain-containing protein n=1 Tax=Neonectria ditissima TaxID=78410 RepID=A0A0P7BT40_9HYPO|nr:hypothetical protein AK830_g3005 [Neonectria ditissima]
MASLTEQPYAMFPPHHHSDSADEFAHHAVYSSGPMDVSIPADAYGSFHHQQLNGPDVFPGSMGFEPALYAEAAPSNYMLNGRASPGMYDETDMRMPSSSGSTASAPSAASSNIGSPESNHGQMGAVPDWNPHLGVQPGIVGNDYIVGSDYSSFAPPGMEELAAYDFGAPKGFVGELDAASTVPVAVVASPRFPAAQRQRPPRHSLAYPYPCHTTATTIATTTAACSSASTFPSSALPVAQDRAGVAVEQHGRHRQHGFLFSPSGSSSSSSSSSSFFFGNSNNNTNSNTNTTATISSTPTTPTPTPTPTPISATTRSSPCSKRRRLLGPSLAISPTETRRWPSQPARHFVTNPSPNRRAAAFFSQSSGHFVAPLQSSAWSPSRISSSSAAAIATSPTMIADLAPATDPALIQPDVTRPPMGMPSFDAHFQQPTHHYPSSPSATASSPQPNMMRTNSSSPFLHSGPFQPAFPSSPYGAPIDNQVRATSMSHFVAPTPGDYHSSDDKEKLRCTWPDCGKTFKDLKAHMLTHQNERPEKCPIQTCEYHVKGFARKYDKNRHTLTHYKGTMVCGFCPGSGSAAEKSFNRADVFKRHLTAVHGVEQTPPNSRKKSTNVNTGKKLTGYAPDATGKCSTCSQTFSNAQDFYEHLDDCVLRIVQQEDPAEAINAKRLAEVENDKDVHQTLEKNNLPTTTEATSASDEDEEVETGDEEDRDDSSKASHSPMTRKKGNPANGVQKSRGVTHSRGGVTLTTKSRGRKSRRDYPSSWGFDKGQMTMKKRVMAVFDGPRRLAKDDMMLSTDHEVRIKLSDGNAYVTDLDVQTLKRAEGFLGATEEEKGPWISDDPTGEQLEEMQMMLENKTATV